MGKSLSEQLAEKGYLNPEQTATVEKEIARSKATVAFWKSYQPLPYYPYRSFDWSFNDLDCLGMDGENIVDQTDFLLTKEEFDALDFIDEATEMRLERKLESYELYCLIQDGFEHK